MSHIHLRSLQKTDEYSCFVAKFAALLIDHSQFAAHSRAEFINAFKMHLSADRSVLVKPLLIVVFIASASETRMEPWKMVKILFFSCENPEFSESLDNGSLLGNEFEIDEAFKELLIVLKKLDTHPYYPHLLSTIFELSMEMLGFNVPKFSVDWTHRRGQTLVLSLFMNYRELQENIINRLLREVLHQNQKRHIKLLHECCAFSKTALVACLANVQFTFKCLLASSVERAKLFLSCIMPFIKIDSSMKDAFLLCLRQSLLSCDREVQHVAILGYLRLLKNFRSVKGDINLTQCTQFASDSYGLTQRLRQLNADELPSLCGEMMCLEIFEYLKRCLCLHEHTRIFIYQGLKEAVAHNTQILEAALDLLFHQVEQFSTEKLALERDDFLVNPMSLESLPYLLSSIVYCLNISSELACKFGKGSSPRELILRNAMSRWTETFLKTKPEVDEIGSNSTQSLCALVLMEFCSSLDSSCGNERCGSLFQYHLFHKSKELRLDDHEPEALLSLKFIMSEAWKCLDPDAPAFYSDKTYKNFIWKHIALVSLHYINTMAQALDDGKSLCAKLTSTVEFVCRVLMHPAVLHATVDDETELDRLVEKSAGILHKILLGLILNYSSLPLCLLKDIDTFLDVDAKKQHSHSFNVILKLINLTTEPEHSSALLSKTSCSTLSKVLKLVLDNTTLDRSEYRVVKENLLHLLSSPGEIASEVPNFVTIFEIYLTLITSPLEDCETLSSIIAKLLSESENKEKPNCETEVESSNFQLTFIIVKLLLEFVSKFLERNGRKVRALRNGYRLHRAVMNPTKKGKISKNSLFDILSLNPVDIELLSTEFSALLNVLHSVVSTSLSASLYLGICRTCLCFFNALTSLIGCQKDLLIINRLCSVSPAFVALINKTTIGLVPLMHCLISKFGIPENDENIPQLKPQKRKKTRFSTFAEMRLVPNLVYTMENFEKEAVSTGKLAGLDLTIGSKSNTARDFRIDLSKI